MKRIPLFFLTVGLGAALLWGQPEPGFQKAWRHYSFAVRLFGGMEVAGGELDGKKTVKVNPGDTSSLQGTLLLGSPDVAPLYGFGLGVRMDAHRVSFFLSQSPADVTHDQQSGKAGGDQFILGLDYRFDLLQRQEIRSSFGGGFHFAYRDLDPLFFPLAGNARRARLSGNGLQLAAGVGWWWRERLSLSIETEYRVTAHRNIGLGDEGFKTKGYLFEHQWIPRAELWIFF